MCPFPAQALSGMAGEITSTDSSCFSFFCLGIIIVVIVVVFPSICSGLFFSLQIYTVDLSHIHLWHTSSAKFSHLCKIII